MVAHCHKQIREIAKGICGSLYEALMGDNEFYAAWRNSNPGANAKELERRFIERNWGQCISEARKALVMILKDETASEAMKEEAFEVLVLDNSLVRGRTHH